MYWPSITWPPASLTKVGSQSVMCINLGCMKETQISDNWHLLTVLWELRDIVFLVLRTAVTQDLVTFYCNLKFVRNWEALTIGIIFQNQAILTSNFKQSLDERHNIKRSFLWVSIANDVKRFNCWLFGFMLMFTNGLPIVFIFSLFEKWGIDETVGFGSTFEQRALASSERGVQALWWISSILSNQITQQWSLN